MIVAYLTLTAPALNKGQSATDGQIKQGESKLKLAAEVRFVIGRHTHILSCCHDAVPTYIH